MDGDDADLGSSRVVSIFSVAFKELFDLYDVSRLLETKQWIGNSSKCMDSVQFRRRCCHMRGITTRLVQREGYRWGETKETPP